MAFNINGSKDKYDVIIVGSGAGGGMAGYVLAHAGLRVLMLESGPFFDPAKDSLQMRWPWESPRRGASTNRAFGDFDGAFGGWEIDGEPYTNNEGSEFRWFRSRMLGGRTNHWGRISLRFGPKDFKGGSFDGATDDWPITYEEVKPYYDKVDVLIGVYGTNEGLEDDPDGIFLKPPKPRLHEILIMEEAKKKGIPVIPGRGSVLTEPLKNNSQRGVCFNCGQCGRSCKVYGDFSSSSALVIPAIRTGNLEVLPNSLVREVLVDGDGLAKGVSYVSKEDMQEYQVYGEQVILAASACESARILLNSKSRQHPQGLANSSGVVGRYLHDSTGVSVAAYLPRLKDRKRYNEDGVGSLHVYAPWWLDNSKLDFPRGYHIEFGGGMNMPSYGYLNDLPRFNGALAQTNGEVKKSGGYGRSLKEEYRSYFGTKVVLAGRGLAIARKDNYCEIDSNTVDKYGIPVLKFHYKWHDAEIKQGRHMQDTFHDLFTGMGAVITSQYVGADRNYGLKKPGEIIHEVGTVRMGDDPKTSALNKWCQAHDCKNLFVVDGAPFVQQGDKNPTWTILALSMRTSEYILEQRKRRNL
ncbi:GMC family oxidoreductase [Parapedobacter defluvii]|uniref:GMC family oxidoreductase n=1 Tax=Parapedobacter defluvii TaxID=2045106 RepID=A0ABQ1ME37_9SPHI|nr:GMC family oxidoreductase [Parapedobacter defluvii]RQP19443.1 MAG: GMC family oxidoreductase [Parapedobacter sp.]GGC37504.1 GMC family oxidoreductase [Parapedobacter defluvii]